MQRLAVSGAVRPIYVSLGVKRLKNPDNYNGQFTRRPIYIFYHISLSSS